MLHLEITSESCNGKARKLHVSLNSGEFYEISQRQKSSEFLEKYKKRAAHEWKNGEQKRFHGLARAKGYGLKSVSTQAKLTALVVNLKRIAAIIGADKPDSETTIATLLCFRGIFWAYRKALISTAV